MTSVPETEPIEESSSDADPFEMQERRNRANLEKSGKLTNDNLGESNEIMVQPSAEIIVIPMGKPINA